MHHLKRIIPHVGALFIATVFLDSLRYKFIDHPKTQVIFGKLDAWASTIGFPGLFSHTGLFSQYVIGSAEFLASALLLLGIFARLRLLQAYGALIAFFIMTGALTFHLFTPLGIDPNNDGGGLFAAACVVWLASIMLIALRWSYYPWTKKAV